MLLSADPGRAMRKPRPHCLGWDLLNHKAGIRRRILKIKQMNLILLLFSRNTFPLELHNIFRTLLQIIQITGFSFPHLNNPISRCSYNEGLCCLERGNTLVSHRQRLWAPPPPVITRSCLPLVLNFLFHGKGSRRKPEVKSWHHILPLGYLLLSLAVYVSISVCQVWAPQGQVSS